MLRSKIEVDQSLVDFAQLASRARQVFTPAAPVQAKDVFAGRVDQVRRILSTFGERGKHAILYGERGAGKTSIANVIHEDLGVDTWARVACTSSHKYSDLWLEVFRSVTVKSASSQIGLTPRVTESHQCIADLLPAQLNVADVILAVKTYFKRWFFVFDEYDRLQDPTTKRLMSDTIKGLSDAGAESTIFLVGVAEDIDQLVEDHPSIERCASQIFVPLMTSAELADVLHKSWRKIGRGVRGEAAAIQLIVRLSQGYPHYTHALGLKATLEAFSSRSVLVKHEHVLNSIQQCLAEVQQSVQASYVKAIESSQADATFRFSILACALTPVDDLGYFRLSDVAATLSEIRGAPVRPQAIISHLAAFSTTRGPVLKKEGPKGNVKYKFANPMLRVFVVLQGVNTGALRLEALERLHANRGGAEEPRA